MSNKSKRPIILKKMIMKSKIMPGNSLKVQNNINSMNITKPVIKVSTVPLYREDVIFQSKDETYLPGEYRSITIINRLYLNNNCKTIAKCVTRHMETVLKTSENLTNLIGAVAYNTVFYALCSVINPEYKIKGILSLLTVYNNTPLLLPTPITTPSTTAVACQTEETRIEFNKTKARKRARKVLVPHVVRPENFKTKYIIDPFTKIVREVDASKYIDKRDADSESDKVSEFNQEDKELVPNIELCELKSVSEIKKSSDDESTPKSLNIATEFKPEQIKEIKLPDLGYLHDENSSNDSSMSISNLTFKTSSDILNDPLALVNQDNIVQNIEKHIKVHPEPSFLIILKDKTEIKVPYKPEDMFHIATKDNLEGLDAATQNKLLFHQMEIDHEHCITFRDEDGYLPIHLAVLNEDIDMLKRQCVVLKMRGETVDIPASNGSTALSIAIEYHTSQQSLRMLDTILRHGADPLESDAAHSTVLHRAAELRTDHLATIIHRAKQRARELITESVEELKTPGWEDKSDEELSNILMKHISELFDKQGDTPLMLACKHGHYENVRLLLEAAPTCANVKNPNSGNTALFMAVSAACNLAAEKGNKTKIVDHFRKTMELLLDYGADPSLENHNNFNASMLLSEFGCSELSTLIANKVAKTINTDVDTTDCKNYHLYRQGNSVTIQKFNQKPVAKQAIDKIEPSNESIPKKPVIVENILVKSAINEDKVGKVFVIKPAVVKKALKRPLMLYKADSKIQKKL